MAAWIACVADARPIEQYAEMLTDAGLTVRHTERHDYAITRMIDQIEARLTLIRITARERAETLGLDLDHAGPVLAAARTAINESSLGYSLLIASR